MRVPVLTYHAAIFSGTEYSNNDHVALADDLETIRRTGKRIVPLRAVAEAVCSGRTERMQDCVALSCDDGSDFDYRDIVHPDFGMQRSFVNIMDDFRRRHQDTAVPHMTSFVIASPDARRALDQRALLGQGWMGDSWWRPAMQTGLMAIENHSWDHNHGCLDGNGPDDLARGSFLDVVTPAQAEYQIGQAQALLSRQLAPHRPSLFCYPFGHVNEFLRQHWLPRHGPALGLIAAFGDGAAPVTAASDRWNLPRYVCGWHWKTPAQLVDILQQQ